MRIHDIEIRNFRSLKHFKLTDIPDNGVIVISGDNEAGKSTVVEALQLLQNPKVKFDSNTAQLKSIQTLGDDQPIFVSMRATLGPVTFRIAKQYKKKTSAVLTFEAPRRAEYKGKEAEDKFRELLSEHLDVSLSQALLVPQGEVNPVINAAGIPALGAALEQLDGDASNTDDTELMKAVDERYQRYYTLKGKPRLELESAQSERDKALAELETAEAEVRRLEDDVAHIERENRRLADAAEAIPSAKAELATRRAEHESALLQQAELDKALAAVQAAEHRLSVAIAAREQRTLLQTELVAANKKCVELGEALEDLRAAQDTHIQRMAVAQKQEQESTSAVAQLRQQLTVARQTLDQARAVTEFSSIREVLADLDARDSAVRELRERIPTNPVEATTIQALDEATLAVKIAEAKVSAHSATIALSASSPTTVKVAGKDVTLGECNIALTEETNLQIGAVSATFTPAAGGESDKAQLSSAREKLQHLLRELECSDADEAHAKFEAEQELVRALDAALRERDVALAGRDEKALRATADVLARKVAESDPHEVDLEAAKLEVGQLETTLAEAESEMEASKRALESESKNNKIVELKVQETYLEAAQSEKEKLAQTLAMATQTEQELDQDVQTATAHVTEVQEEVERLKAATPDMHLVKGLLEGAEAKLEQLQATMHSAEKNIELRRGQINAAEGAAEELIRCREAAEAAQYRFDRVLEQAKGIALLRETLLRHRDEARARYAQPFAEKLTSLASVLFGPQVSFELTDQLDIEQRILDDTAVTLSDLSGGAREQLGILARFAVAELVSDHEGVPIFLDDALGYADAERLARMNYLLGLMGKQHQVFVLTCMPSRYADVVGKLAYEMAELKATE